MERLDQRVLAAIDVGTNAVRLELARPLPDGSLETLHQERDPIRPGEGLFTSGTIGPKVVDRLVATLRRYASLCRRYDAHVRVVATSALRDARNRDEVVRRVRKDAGLDIEVVSGKEEARLICLGVLHGRPAGTRSLCLDIGGGSTEVAVAKGAVPTRLWSIAIGAVRLTQLFDTGTTMSSRKLELLREYVEEAVARALPKSIAGAPRRALGSSGTIQAVISFAADQATGHATRPQLSRAVTELARMPLEERRRHFDPRRADIIVAGAVILESLVRRLKLQGVAAVNRGLRDGILYDLHDKVRGTDGAPSLEEAALSVGRRFHFDEPHALQVRRLALTLFDALQRLHGLPKPARQYLEVAALLHDVGNVVSYTRHHKHSYYLIQNADIPGLADREREIAARVARYHRRSTPEAAHVGLTGLTPDEARTVKRLATLLRLADSLDRSHHQPVDRIGVRIEPKAVQLKVKAKRPVDLELWDAEHEAALFQRVLGRRVLLKSSVGRG